MQHLPGSANADVVVCKCGMQAYKLITRKEGPNFGRHFYTCGDSKKCNFFQWCTDVTSSSVQIKKSSGCQEQPTPGHTFAEITRIEIRKAQFLDPESLGKTNSPFLSIIVPHRNEILNVLKHHDAIFHVPSKCWMIHQDNIKSLTSSLKRVPNVIVVGSVPEPLTITTKGLELPQVPVAKESTQPLVDIRKLPTMVQSMPPGAILAWSRSLTADSFCIKKLIGVESALSPNTREMIKPIGSDSSSTPQTKLLADQSSNCEGEDSNRAMAVDEMLNAVKDRYLFTREGIEKYLPNLTALLLPFQVEGVYFALKRYGRALIADEMGLGKTRQGLTVACCFADSWPLLIVCPASLRLHWRDEILRFLSSHIDASDIHILDSVKKKSSLPSLDESKQKPGFKKGIWIIGYEVASKLFPSYSRSDITPQSSSTNTSKHAGSFSKTTAAKNSICFQVIIADECHRIKSREAVCTKTLLPMMQQAKHVVLLSGTPAINRPKELWTLISALDPKCFPSYAHYSERYCNGQQRPWGWDDNGSSNLEELQELLSKAFMIRRRKTQVIDNLPKKTRIFIRTKLTREAKQKLRALQLHYNELSTKLHKDKPEDYDEMVKLRMRLKSMLSEMMRTSGEGKLPAAVAYVFSRLLPLPGKNLVRIPEEVFLKLENSSNSRKKRKVSQKLLARLQQEASTNNVSSYASNHKDRTRCVLSTMSSGHKPDQLSVIGRVGGEQVRDIVNGENSPRVSEGELTSLKPATNQSLLEEGGFFVGGTTTYETYNETISNPKRKKLVINATDKDGADLVRTRNIIMNVAGTNEGNGSPSLPPRSQIAFDHESRLSLDLYNANAKGHTLEMNTSSMSIDEAAGIFARIDPLSGSRAGKKRSGKQLSNYSRSQYCLHDMLPKKSANGLDASESKSPFGSLYYDEYVTDDSFVVLDTSSEEEISSIGSDVATLVQSPLYKSPANETGIISPIRNDVKSRDMCSRPRCMQSVVLSDSSFDSTQSSVAHLLDKANELTPPAIADAPIVGHDDTLSPLINSNIDSLHRNGLSPQINQDEDRSLDVNNSTLTDVLVLSPSETLSAPILAPGVSASSSTAFSKFGYPDDSQCTNLVLPERLVMSQVKPDAARIVTIAETPKGGSVAAVVERVGCGADGSSVSSLKKDEAPNSNVPYKFPKKVPKILVFAHHKVLLERMELECKLRGVKYVRIDGSTTPANRHKFCAQFRDDEETQLAICSILAVGVGLSFVTASLAIFLEISWSPGWLLQAEDRIHRIGQLAKEVQIHYLVADESPFADSPGSRSQKTTTPACENGTFSTKSVTSAPYDVDESDYKELVIDANGNLVRRDEECPFYRHEAGLRITEDGRAAIECLVKKRNAFAEMNEASKRKNTNSKGPVATDDVATTHSETPDPKSLTFEIKYKSIDCIMWEMVLRKVDAIEKALEAGDLTQARKVGYIPEQDEEEDQITGNETARTSSGRETLGRLEGKTVDIAKKAPSVMELLRSNSHTSKYATRAAPELTTEIDDIATSAGDNQLSNADKIMCDNIESIDCVTTNNARRKDAIQESNFRQVMCLSNGEEPLVSNGSDHQIVSSYCGGDLVSQQTMSSPQRESIPENHVVLHQNSTSVDKAMSNTHLDTDAIDLQNHFNSIDDLLMNIEIPELFEMDRYISGPEPVVPLNPHLPPEKNRLGPVVWASTSKPMRNDFASGIVSTNELENFTLELPISFPNRQESRRLSVSRSRFGPTHANADTTPILMPLHQSCSDDEVEIIEVECPIVSSSRATPFSTRSNIPEDSVVPSVITVAPVDSIPPALIHHTNEARETFPKVEKVQTSRPAASSLSSTTTDTIPPAISGRVSSHPQATQQRKEVKMVRVHQQNNQ